MGDYLQKEHGFHHENVEDWPDRDTRFGGSDGSRLIDDEIDKIDRKNDHIVATFGFRPNAPVDVCIVERFTQKGFEHIWFGNRDMARKFATERENKNERPKGNFQLHVNNIDKTKILSKIKYRGYNPFTANGLQKSLGLISQELGLVKKV